MLLRQRHNPGHANNILLDDEEVDHVMTTRRYIPTRHQPDGVRRSHFVTIPPQTDAFFSLF